MVAAESTSMLHSNGKCYSSTTITRSVIIEHTLGLHLWHVEEPLETLVIHPGVYYNVCVYVHPLPSMATEMSLAASGDYLLSMSMQLELVQSHVCGISQ